MEGSDTSSLLVADVPGDWRRPRAGPAGSWLLAVRADLDLMDTSLEGAISFAKDRTMWKQMIDGIILTVQPVLILDFVL